MSPTLSLIGADLVRALSAAAEPRIDDAVRERAERAARSAGDGGGVHVMRRDAGRYVVTVRPRDDEVA